MTTAYYLLKLQNERFQVFKKQDVEKGCFDVTFEIEGKKLLANKHMVTTVSETLNAWLTDRWTTKDAPVKIETYSYNDFYQFFCFIYSGNCKINQDNAFQLTDMAEFYGVQCFKEFCDNFLSSLEKSIENIEELTEFALKYSLPKLMDSIKSFISSQRGEDFLKMDNFLAFKKPFVQFLSTVNRGSLCFTFPLHTKDGDWFERVYKWSEHHVMKLSDKSINLQETVKAELYTIIAQPKFYNMNIEFLMGFVVEKGFYLSPFCFGQFYARNFLYTNAQDLFQSVYKLAKKQAIKKKLITRNDENFDIVESIKACLSEVIPLVEFAKMDKQFLMDFVVAKGIITAEQASHVYHTRVQLTTNGKSIAGVFKDELGILKAIQNQNLTSIKPRTVIKLRFTKLKFPIPKTPSTVIKKKNVDWYLCLERDGILAFKHHSKIDQKFDYLLTEMKDDDCNDNFQLNYNELISFKAFYNNIKAF